MKTIKFTAFLFYRYYSTGRWAGSTPLLRTRLSMTLLGFIHLIQVLIIFHRTDFIPFKSSDNIWWKRFIMLLVLLPIYLLVAAITKKDDIDQLSEEYKYNWDKVFNGNVFLIVYIILSFALTIILAIIMK
jgi:hypothetical protein